ncbi:hypothetical protein X739_14895 [Mesorhizobium sp. LNHC220B00]|nr:hypothetical protein X739_14895 [Mesorhizobium sp. LNHC220B00]
MRGRSWIKAVREDEARRVRARIAQLEQDLTAASARTRQLRQDAGPELRNAKFRLDRIDECIGAMR